jgi:hypothetical protein
MQTSIGLYFFWTCLFAVMLAASAETLTNAEVAHNPSFQNMQLALKKGPSNCVPQACKIKKVGWCICCGDVVDCRLATGGKKKAQ